MIDLMHNRILRFSSLGSTRVWWLYQDKKIVLFNSLYSLDIRIETIIINYLRIEIVNYVGFIRDFIEH